MYTIETRPPPLARPGSASTVTIVLAALFLAGAVVPVAAGALGPDPTLTKVEAPITAFHHHFYRGVPGQNRGTSDADFQAIAADRDAQEEAAMAYCTDRYRSYDPASGTYLGYDGREHACP